MSGLYALHRLVLPEAGRPLAAALAEAVPGLSRRVARRAIIAGLVRIGAETVTAPAAIVPRDGCTVELDLRHGWRRAWLARRYGAPPARLRLAILHRDDELCIVDKPAGLPSVPPPGGGARTPHLGALLKRQLARGGVRPPHLGLVHRLDRLTSGCVAVALNREAQRVLAAQFAARAAERIYRCLVRGRPRQEAGVLRARQGRGPDGRRALVGPDEPGVEAETHWRVLARWREGCELEVRLATGRTHQVRVALAALGCPVLGDPLYGPRPARAPRLYLHAWQLALDHPGDGRRLRVTAPLPEDWAAGIALLGG